MARIAFREVAEELKDQTRLRLIPSTVDSVTFRSHGGYPSVRIRTEDRQQWWDRSRLELDGHFDLALPGGNDEITARCPERNHE